MELDRLPAPGITEERRDASRTLERFEEAAKYLGEALAQQPGNADVGYNLGIAQLRGGACSGDEDSGDDER